MPRAQYFALLFALLCLLSAPAPTGAAVWDETYSTPRVYEAKQDINIRSQPTKNSPVLGVLRKGQTATVPALEKGWYKVLIPDGTKGYIYKRFLKQVPGAQAQMQSSETVKPKTKKTPPPEPQTPEATPVEPAREKSKTPAPKLKTEPAKKVELKKAASPAPVQTGQPEQTAPAHETPTQKAAPKTKVENAQVPAAPAASASTGVDCVRIKFKNNALTGTAELSVEKGGHDCYEINLEKSQWMEVCLKTPDNAAMFEIFSPTGNTLCSREVHWLGRSGQVGEYIIFVSQDSGAGPYTLKVQVK